jgi:hypothetical protein
MTNGEPMTAGEDSVFERRVAMRRQVPGDAYVDRAMADASVLAETSAHE